MTTRVRTSTRQNAENKASRRVLRPAAVAPEVAYRIRLERLGYEPIEDVAESCSGSV